MRNRLMGKIFTYISLHFKLSLRQDKNVDKKSNILTTILGVIVIAIGLMLFKYLFDIVNKQFFQEITPLDFSIVLYSIIGIVLIVFGISKEIKLFLNAKDTQIVARFPMSTLSLFVANLIIVYLYMLSISVLIINPLMIMFVSTMNVVSFGVVMGIIFSSILAPLIPFAIATILVVSTMYFLVALQNRNITKLVIFLVVLICLFVLYSIFLNFLAEYYINQSVNTESKGDMIKVILSFNNIWNFFCYPAHIAFGDKIFKNISLLLLTGLVLLALGILIAIPVVDRIRMAQLEGDKKALTKRTKLTKDSPISAILKKEFKEIIRTHTYAYFYLGIAIVMPIMVLLTNSIIRKVGNAQMGGDIAFGVSILVVLAFVSMINSFAGSALSREGKEFYVTKIIPVDFRKQLLAKGILNILVSMIAVIISAIILLVMKFVTIADCAIIVLVALLLTLGIIFNGLNINVRKPNISTGASGSESQTNSLVTMFVGLIISAVEGILAILLSFFIDSGYIYLLLISISCIYALVSTLIFIFTANNRYFRIE